MKKVLILNGSPRKSGYTKEMIDVFVNNCKRECQILDCQKLDIKYCVDCRYCQNNFECVVNDDMQSIYKKIEEADVLIFATPIYFGSVSAQIKKVIDRFQVYFYRNMQGQNKELKKKTGVLIAVGGAKVYPKQFKGTEDVVIGAMGNFNCTLEKKYYLSNTDSIDNEELNAIKLAIEEFAKIV